MDNNDDFTKSENDEQVTAIKNDEDITASENGKKKLSNKKKKKLIIWGCIIVAIIVISICIPVSNNDTPNLSGTEQAEDDSNNITMTMGQRNALAKAKIYLRSMAFSKLGLIDQLMFEKYSLEDSTYAAENCGANWNEQAKIKAKTYLDIMAFSRQGLIDQLIFEKFTLEEATYGVEANGY